MLSVYDPRVGPAAAAEILRCEGLTLSFGPRLVQSDLNFSVRRGSIFAVMGGSGCGKSTVLRALIGLLRPTKGAIFIQNENLWGATAARRNQISQKFGVLFQGGALWSSMTVAENVALPLLMLTHIDQAAITQLVRLKLALVGLAAAEDTFPSALSGGMRKRAGLARALALDPEILFFDEPSAGLDPISSQRLDELILELRDGFGATVILVSHELSSLYAICDDGIFLDANEKTAIGRGAPRDLRENSAHPTIQSFMRRTS